MVDVWLEVENGHFSSAMSQIIFQSLIFPKFLGGETDTKIVKENVEKLKTALEVYESHLSKLKYLAGDFVSLADISHFPAAYYLLGGPHASVVDAYPHVKAWVAELMDRPSAKKVAELMKMPTA
jgi:glutathione S-transferase